MRENAQAKGLRYLVEHRLTVLRVDKDAVEAECRGDGAMYALGWKDGAWFCACPAKTTCSHLHALQAVTVWTAAP
jgi:hypothetical protein